MDARQRQRQVQELAQQLALQVRLAVPACAARQVGLHLSFSWSRNLQLQLARLQWHHGPARQLLYGMRGCLLRRWASFAGLGGAAHAWAPRCWEARP